MLIGLGEDGVDESGKDGGDESGKGGAGCPSKVGGVGWVGQGRTAMTKRVILIKGGNELMSKIKKRVDQQFEWVQ